MGIPLASFGIFTARTLIEPLLLTASIGPAYNSSSAGKYVEGTIEALSQDEANFKLKEQKIIITNIKNFITMFSKLSFINSYKSTI